MLEITLKKDDKKTVDKRDNKDIPIKLSIIIVIRIDEKSYQICYKSMKNKLVYNEIWNEIAKLFIIEKINKNIIKISRVNKTKMKTIK